MKKVILVAAFYGLVLTFLLAGIGSHSAVVSAQGGGLQAPTADDQRLAAEVNRRFLLLFI